VDVYADARDFYSGLGGRMMLARPPHIFSGGDGYSISKICGAFCIIRNNGDYDACPCGVHRTHIATTIGNEVATLRSHDLCDVERAARDGGSDAARSPGRKHLAATIVERVSRGLSFGDNSLSVGSWRILYHYLYVRGIRVAHLWNVVER